MLTGCSSRALHEAQDVVKTADSLRAEGVAYTDSMALAEAYNTLEKWQYLYPTDYARVCYYYGRLLRNNDDPVAAMQVFINGTHSHTRDYHILARTYSNMGSICHLANEFQLSYDMYSRSANMFLKNGDTLLYYYLLNDMAFELVCLDSCEAAQVLLSRIQENRSDIFVRRDIVKTELHYFKHLHQYDTLIAYINSLPSYEGLESFTILSKAQAFYYLHCYDSAYYYAQQALHLTKSNFERDNAFYILIHCDSIYGGEGVYELTGERADVEKRIEIQHGKLSQATQLLGQDLSRKPDWRWWLIATLIISFGIISFVSLQIWRRRKQMLEMRVETMANNHVDDIITSIKQHIDINDLNHTLHWKNYAAMKSDADLYVGSIVSKLEARKLNEVEIRFCILTILDMSLKQIADYLHYGYPSGIKTLKKRISNKLGTTPPNLKEYLFKMMTNTLF